MPEHEDESPMRAVKPVDALEQSAEYLGLFHGPLFDLGDGETWRLPNPSLLTDEEQARYDAYLFENEQFDHDGDETDANGKIVRRGTVLDPPRRNGELVESYNTRLAKALMGDKRYRKFIAAGGRSSQIRIHWLELNRRVADRMAEDSKSRDRSVVVEPVSDGD